MATGSSTDHAALATRVEQVQTTAQEKTSLSSWVEAVGRALARYGLVVVVGWIGLMAPDKHGLIYLPESAFAAASAPNAAAEEPAVLAAVQRPISSACITVAVDRPLWKARPTWFLVAEQDRMIRHNNQRFMAQRMKARVRAHSIDHTPLVTARSVVVDIIREALAAIVAS